MRDAPKVLVAAAVAAAFAAYALLASRDYAAVDGGVRALEVLRGQVGLVGGNNHLLYPAYVRAWAALAAAAGIRLGDPAPFLHAAQLLNAAAAAACVTLVALLARRASGSTRVAVAAAALVGLSHAFLLHATHGSEPLPGLAWSLVGVWLVVRGVDRGSTALLALGGAVQAVAMASYESMILLAPALLAYAWLAGGCEGRWNRAAAFAFAAVGATALLYAVLYAFSGTGAPVAMAERFVRLEGFPRVFGGLGATKTLNLPLGFANAVAPVVPPGYAGLRSLFDGRVAWQWTALAVAAMAAAIAGAVVLGWLAWRAARPAAVPGAAGVSGAPGPRERAAWVALAVAAVCTLAPLVYWNPLYDKLWLQPLVVGALAVSLLARQNAGARPMRAASALVPALAIAAANLPGAIRAHLAPTPCLAQAEAVARTVSPRDLLVRGWEPVAFALGVFFEPRVHGIDLVQAAIESGPAALARLDAERQAARERGGDVYYLGVLDADRARWEPFLGRRAGLPYDALAGVRARARALATYACAGATVHLWKEVGPGGVEPPANGP